MLYTAMDRETRFKAKPVIDIAVYRGGDAVSSIAFAGLTDGERFTIITCPPVPEIAHIHDRMPVILAAAAEQQWMDPGLAFGQVSGALIPYPGEALAAEEEPPADKGQPDMFG